MKRLKIGIIGCGTIGSSLAKTIEEEFKDRTILVGICDILKERALRLSRLLKSKPPLLSMEKLIIKAELIIEAASAQVSAQVASRGVAQGKDVMIMSVGGLLGRGDIFDLARKKGSHIYLPSGAICGLDGLKGARLGKISKVTLTTRKPPQAFQGASYIKRKGIDLERIKDETVLFDGPAEEAIAGFPKNVNVAATLSLAGIGARKTRVRIISSPLYRRNVHSIEIEGEFGRLISRTENVPSPQNPKTSYLAVLSARATLKQILEPVKIGT